MAKEQPKSTQEPLSVLAKTKKRFDDSWDYAKDNWHAKWDRDNKLYDGERTKPNYVNSVTDTSVPMVFSTIETMVSAMNNANLRFDYASGDPMKKVSTAPLNALVDEDWDDDGWDSLLEEMYRETFNTGMCGAIMSWDADDDRPHVDAFAMRDAIVDPTIKQPSQLQRPGAYAGRRFYVRKGTLEGVQIIDADPNSKTYGELVPRYKNIEEGPVDGQEEPTDKQLKEIFGASTLKTAATDQDELIEIWDIDRVVTMKNRTAIIEDRENPHKVRHELSLRRRYVEEVEARRIAGEFLSEQEVEMDGQMIQDYAIDQDGYNKALKDAEARAKREARGIVPIFFFRNYRRLSLFYAKSEIDSIAKEQELLNDMTNMESDFIIRQLAPQRELDPEYQDWIDLIDNDPDTVYPFKPGSLGNIAPPVLPANSFNNRLNIKNEMREATAIAEASKGIQSVKETTAEEVKTLRQGTGQRIESKARIFEKDGLYWWGWILMKFYQLYRDNVLVVEAPDANQDPEEVYQKYGIELPKGAAIYDPAEYQGDWRPRISLEIDAQNKQIDEMRSARESYGIIIQDPTNNLTAAKKILYPKMFNIDKADLDEITEQDPMAGAMGGMDPMLAAGGAVDPAAQADPTAETGMAISPEMMAELMAAQQAQGGAGADAALAGAVNG